MKNEEKITELCKYYEMNCDWFIEALGQMAEWKEEQMIEKACEKLVEIDLEDEDTEDVSNEYQEHIYVLSNHFLKKFKQEMEEE